jgi:hypothetical protein
MKSGRGERIVLRFFTPFCGAILRLDIAIDSPEFHWLWPAAGGKDFQPLLPGPEVACNQKCVVSAAGYQRVFQGPLVKGAVLDRNPE